MKRIQNSKFKMSVLARAQAPSPPSEERAGAMRFGKLKIENCQLPIFNFTLLLCALCVLCVSRSAAADQIIEATLTVTNFSGIATNGSATLTVNGATRTATNNVAANPALYFLGTNSMLPAKTNLYNHLALYPFGSAGTRLTLINLGANSFKLRGQLNQSISVSIAGAWGTALLSTNTITNFTGVTVPLEYYSAAEATNIASELTRFFSLASNAAAAAATGLSNHLNQFLHQTSSNKLFYASTNSAGAILNARQMTGTNVALTNVLVQWIGLGGVTSFSGTNILATNVTLRHFKLLDGRPEGTNAGITNGYTLGLTNINSVSSNHINFGDALRSEGSGPNSLQLGSNATATALRAITAGNNSTNSGQDGALFGNQATNHATYGSVFGNRSSVSGLASASFGSLNHVSGPASYAFGQAIQLTNAQQVSVGYATINSGDNTSTVGAQAQAADYSAAAFGFQANATKINSLALGPMASAVHSNSAAIGPPDHSGAATATTTTNQIVLATANHSVYVPGVLSVALYSNLTAMAGSTNRFPAGSDISFGRFSITTVANGHNTLNAGTNVYIDLTGAPTAPWTWGGITGGNRDGKLLKIRNATGWAADILHNSGTEPTASLRISTPTATSITLNNSGWAEFLYDPSASRWQLVNLFNTATPAASATNALAALATNGTLVTAAWTNLNLLYGAGLLLQTTNTSGNVDIQISNGAPGETNYNGEVSLTNAATLGHVYDKSNGTNRLRSLRGGDLITLTNEGTNITLAASAAYVLPLGQITSISPADSTTYYFGQAWVAAATSTFNDQRIYVPKAGTLKTVQVHVNIAGTLASTETVSHSIRINDATDVTLTTTNTYNALHVDSTTTGLSQALAAGDYVVLKITTPAWVTNPTTVRWTALLYIE